MTNNHEVYKYRAINDNSLRQIEFDEIYFQEPTNFNDPYDCYIYTDDKEPTLTEKLEFESRKFEYKNNTIKKHGAIVNKILTTNLDKFGVCCFTKNENDLLMWSHYGDYHRGVCFVYSHEKLATFFRSQKIAFLKVDYLEDLPYQRAYFKKEELARILQKFVITKSKVWAYENEYRACKDTVSFGSNLKLEPNLLECIVIGSKTSDDDALKILEANEKREKPVPVRKSKKITDNYGLTYESRQLYPY